MILLRAHIFTAFPEVAFGFSTRIGLDREEPYGFNMSKSVGDSEPAVEENREAFFRAVGLQATEVAMQKQVHEDTVRIVTQPGFAGESDAMITNHAGIGLAVSTADCVPVFLYDPRLRVAAGIHSGWRSSAKKITTRTVATMKSEFGCNAADLRAYIGPAASGKLYAVQQDVACQFDENYITEHRGRMMLDLPAFNQGLLLQAGVPKGQIQMSSFCTIANNALLHSYRARGAVSGRAIGVIYMKRENA